jgi:hypothetical protein
MISTRIAGALAAGALALGVLAGSAGTIVIRDAAGPDALDSNAYMGRMATMMAGGSGMMPGGSGMMPGGSGMMTGLDGMGPAGSAMPDWMRQHHQPVSSGPSR